jgi:hypothetical protein
MQTSTSSISQVYSKFNGSDGFTINPNGGQVYIEINFREPKDYNTNTGLMNINQSIIFWKYPDYVQKDIDSRGGGISYMLYDVVSRFSKGKFEQDLTGTIGTFNSAAPAEGNQSQAETNRLNRNSNASVPTIADGTGVSPLTPSTALAAASTFVDPSQLGKAGLLGSVGSINNVLDPMQKLSQNQTITITTKNGQVADGDAGP